MLAVLVVTEAVQTVTESNGGDDPSVRPLVRALLEASRAYTQAVMRASDDPHSVERDVAIDTAAATLLGAAYDQVRGPVR